MSWSARRTARSCNHTRRQTDFFCLSVCLSLSVCTYVRIIDTCICATVLVFAPACISSLYPLSPSLFPCFAPLSRERIHAGRGLVQGRLHICAANAIDGGERHEGYSPRGAGLVSQTDPYIQNRSLHSVCLLVHVVVHTCRPLHTHTHTHTKGGIAKRFSKPGTGSSRSARRGGR